MAPSISTAHTAPRVSGYTLTEKLYEGSHTAVYRACFEAPAKAPPRTQPQSVVIKVLTQAYPSFSDLVKFRHQYTITQNLPIPGIVHPLSLEPWQNSYALVMEDFSGISLQQYAQEQTLSVVDVLAIALQLAEVLNDLGRHRIVHKDIKPANILIHPESKRIKLTDFSISSLLPKESQAIQAPNGLEGTLAYLAPEQTGRMNRGIDYRADFYALGVTLYQLLTNALPFRSDDPLEVVHAHIATPPKAPHQLNNSIPPMVSAIVLKLMAKNAEDRYQSALGLKYDLEQCLIPWKETGSIPDFELGTRDLCDRFLIPEKLYGRQQEVKRLLKAFENTANGSAELMLVAGFSGIGKTAVVHEVHKPITRQQGYFIQGKFDQFNRNLPLSAFVQALRGLMKQLLSESDAQLANWRSEILAAVGENGQLLIEVIPELGQVIGVQPAVAELSGTAAQNRFNRLFQKFIGVFATPAHPLVVFVDDLQWADSASLSLLERLLGNRDQGHLFIIGAYRDNEVSLAHPLMLTLDKLTQAKATLHTITLAPLSEESLNTLVADTLQCAPKNAKPLTQLIYQKTQGNPFFSTQFLKALYTDNLIAFDREAGLWACDVAQVKQLSLTDDVVELMAAQLQKLPEGTQQVLKLSACIGNQFDLATLAIVHDKTPTETAADVWPAIQAGLIIPTSEVYKFYQSQENLEALSPPDKLASSEAVQPSQALSTYRFLHDRVQQAAYSLIPEDQKQTTHFKVGKRLSQTLSKEEQSEKLFEIVNQLNFGVAFVTSPAEKEQLIRLNLAAGRKAKASTAYGAAANYFAVARSLLGEKSWQTEYALTLALYDEAAEVAYLNTDFEQSEQLSSVVLQQTKTLLDQINVYVTKIQSNIAQVQLIEALEIARPVLTLIDSSINLPAAPTPADFKQAFIKTTSGLANRSTAELLQLQAMEDPHQLAAMRILSSIAPPAYFAFPALFPIITLKMVDLSVKFGNTASSAFGYAMYGFILCGVMDDIESGYRFGQLAIDLVDRFNAKHVKAKALTLAGHFINPWKDSLHESLQLLPKAFQAGLESGDLEFSGYAAAFYCFNSVFSGKALSSIEVELATYGEAIAQIKQEHVLPQISLSRQVVLNLLNPTEQPERLVGEAYDESVMVPRHEKTNNRTTLAFVYIAKLSLSYRFENYEQAAVNAAKAEDYLDGVVAMLCIVLFNFYDSLVKLAQFPQANSAEQGEILKKVTQNQLKMKYWADNAPMNYLHKFYLIEAERDRALGNKADAVEHYDLAIAGAKENNFTQEEALANELAAKFYFDWGKTKVAEAYMQEAYYSYVRWGAQAKVAHLEQHYPHLLRAVMQPATASFSPQPNNSTVSSQHTLSQRTLSQHTLSHHTLSQHAHTNHTHTNHTHQHGWLDLPAVMKAAQAISQDIQLDKLLATLMQTAIAHAGAARGQLILYQDHQWQVVAGASQTQTQLLQTPLDHCLGLPQRLVYSVIRTQKTVVFDNLTTAVEFSGDHYIIAHQPKSVLCMPISRQGKLIGILYLENNATAGAFTRDRLEILQLLTSQAAISLENARLYQQTESYSLTLEAEVSQKTEALNRKAQDLEQALQNLQQTQAKLVHTEKMSSLGQLVAGVAHEINNPINFIQGNIKHTGHYVETLVEMLALYQQDCAQPSLAIEEMRADLDLDFVIRDTTKTLSSMKSGCDRIKQIVLSLRNFSRLDESEMKAVDLHSGLESTLLIAQSRLQATGQKPAINIIKTYGELPNIHCYPSQLNQVFLHIINNAIDAVREQHKTHQPPQIQISTDVTEQGTVRVAIANNGTPIPQAIQDRIFDPFFTTKAIGRGAGLGLFVSYSIIQQHQGKLSVKSSSVDCPQPNTEFEIILPLKTLAYTKT